MVILLVQALAFAGYGDAVDGFPTLEERQMHFWNDAIRIDPEAFSVNYGCRFDQFEANEQESQLPLALNLDLNEAARFHSEHMLQFNYFAHDTPADLDDAFPQGRGMAARVGSYYDGTTYGENIAQGQRSPFHAMMSWMCSSGHRANIMRESWLELGSGYANDPSRTYTQNFGAAGRVGPPLTMGTHTRTWAGGEEDQGNEVNLDGVAFAATWGGDTQAKLFVEVNGEVHPMKVAYGNKKRGAFMVELEMPDEDCVQYYFIAQAGEDVYTFPEEGTYGVGNCAFDDEVAQWSVRTGVDFDPNNPDAPRGEDAEPTPGGGGGVGPWGVDGGDGLPAGCQSAPTSAWMVLGGLGLLGRRRRRDSAV